MAEELGQLIGQGGEAEIYAWGEGKVLKLGFPSRSRGGVEDELQAARVAHEAGVPTPAVGETIELDGRIGIVFERVDGPSMLAHLVTHLWQMRRLARQMAEVHAAIHACRAPELISLKDEIRRLVEGAEAAEVDAAAKETILRRLERLPDGDSLCHGDLHPGNVTMSARGPVVIDWTDGRRGDPLADVARTWLLLRMAELPVDRKGRWLLQPVARVVLVAFYALYLRRYRQLRPFADEELAAWKLPNVALRLVRDGLPLEQRRQMMDYLAKAVHAKADGS